MDSATFDDVRAKFTAFWPKAEMPPAVGDLWRRRLSGLNMNCLLECLDEVRVKYYANTPQLKWVLDEYYTLWNDKFRGADMTDMDKAAMAAKQEEEDRESREFAEKVERDLACCCENELRAAAAALPIRVSEDPSSWGKVTKGLVWVKLFASSSSSANQSPNPDHGLPG